MKKLKWLSIFIALALIVSFVLPDFEAKAESEWQKLDRQLQEIQKQKKAAAQKAKAVENQINEVKKEQANVKGEIEEIDAQITETENKLFSLESQVEETTLQAKQAADELDIAKQRVNNRDDLLKTRVRLMYRKGNIGYLDVLLDSNSFSDFIQRFSVLEKILDSDKKILQDNILDKETIEDKKQEIDEALANLGDLYTEVESTKLTLYEQRKDRQVRIASLQDKEQELNEVKESEQEIITALAKKEEEIQKKKYDLQYNGGMFLWPVPESKRITSGFGARVDPFTHKIDGHRGIDIGHAPYKTTLYGADILAAYDGRVLLAQYTSGYGNCIIINHGSGLWTVYGHIRVGGIFVKVGQEVKKGQKIAEVGSTGRSTGAHLHFEVRENNIPVDPWKYLK